MKYAIGSDGAGYALKEVLKKYLGIKGYRIEDMGVFADSQGKITHYPLIAEKVAEAVARGEYDMGILICGTGVGMSIAANKIPGIRAAAVSNGFDAKYTRLHNDANILCLGGRTTGAGFACEIAEIFLTTPFSGEERHRVRVGMIAKIEEKYRIKDGGRQ